MFETTVLDNGLRIISARLPSVATSVGVYVGVGARNEDLANERGLSHYLEHMAFKGTKHRTCEEIARQIEYSGGATNAATSHTKTYYYARVINTEVQKVAEIILDNVFNSIFPVNDIESERNVIKQEIKMISDRPNAVAFYNLIEALWPDQAVGSNIIGTSSDLDRYTQESFQNYVAKWYVPNNVILVAAGDVDHRELVRTAMSHAGDFQKRELDPIQPANIVGGLKTFDKDYQQVNLLMGWPATPYSDIRKKTATNLMVDYISGGMSSPLFVEVREKRGLVYGVGGGYMPHSDTGAFYIGAGAEAKNIDEIINVSMDVLNTYKTIDMWQLERAKNQYKLEVMKNAESASAMMSYMGNSWIAGDKYLRPVEQVIEEIDSITSDEISAIISEILDSQMSFSMVGPVWDSSIKLAENLVGK
mgnify:CR=1 FL=1